MATTTADPPDDDVGTDRLLLRHALLDRGFKPGQGWRRDGQPLGWSLDCRDILLDGRVLAAAARVLADLAADWKPDAFAGTGLSGAPLVAAAIGVGADAPAIGLLIRDRPKEYGLRRQIEGPVPAAGSAVVVVDDLAHSGNTLVRMTEVLRDHGLRPVGAVTLVDFEDGAAERLRAVDVPMRSAFSLAGLGIAATPVESRPRVPWRAPGFGVPGDGVPLARPRDVDRVIVTGTNHGDLVGLGSDGREHWRRHLGPPIHTAPMSVPGIVVIGTDDGELVGVRPVDGDIVWRARLGDRAGGGLAGADDAVLAPVTTGTDAGHLDCLDVRTGARRWSVPLAGYTHAAPWYDARRRLAVAADNTGRLTAAGIDNGEVAWTVELGHAVKADLAGDSERLFAADFGGNLTAVELADGTVAWQRKCGRCLYAVPLVGGGEVVVGGDVHTLCLDASTGSVRWVAQTGAVRGDLTRTRDGGVTLVSLDEGLLTLSPSGRRCRGLPLAAATTGACTWHDGNVLVTTADGMLIAVDPCTAAS